MNSSASAPSRTTCTRLARWCALKACKASFTSLELSSTSRISTCCCAIARFPLQGEIERRPLVPLGFGPDASAVAVHDALGDGQADARPLELLRVMKPLEDFEQLVGIAHVEAGAVIFDKVGRTPVLVRAAADLDDRLLP